MAELNAYHIFCWLSQIYRTHTLRHTLRIWHVCVLITHLFWCRCEILINNTVKSLRMKKESESESSTAAQRKRAAIEPFAILVGIFFVLSMRARDCWWRKHTNNNHLAPLYLHLRSHHSPLSSHNVCCRIMSENRKTIAPQTTPFNLQLKST